MNGPEEKEVKGDAESIANLTCDVVGYPIKFEWRDEDNFLGNSHVCCSTLCSSVDPSNTLTTNQCTTEQVLSREKHFASYKYLKLDRGGELEHRRTGLEILGGGGGGGGGRTRICPTRAEGARTSRGVRGHAPQENFENRVYLMPFPAFWCGFLCIEQVTNEKKILRILVKQNMNKKIARLLSKNCPTN